MQPRRFHRNSQFGIAHHRQKRFYGQDKIYFITTVTHKRFLFFKEDSFCQLFVQNLRLCKQLKNFKLYSFTVMFDHAHLLLKPGEKFNISQVMHSIKQNISCDINRIINHNKYTIQNEANEG